jgi:sarcosine oxidase
VARSRLVTPGPHPGSARSVARTDFLVIGAGVTGLSAARALTRSGCQVTVVDQAEIGHRDGGSHGACRIFRLGYNEPGYVLLARQASALWTELETACGERLLHPTPQLTIGPDLPAVRAAMRAAGAPCELLPAAEAMARFPGVHVTGEVLVEPDSAVIAADRALTGLAGLIPEISTGVRVTSLADDGRRVRAWTDAGQVEARRVIVCAGPWTPGLLATAGISVPGSATLEQVAYLDPAHAAAPVMPIFVHYGGAFPYGLPVPGSRQYKFGLHHSGRPADPDHQARAADPGLLRRVEQAARTYLPGCDPAPVAMERCVYDNSPDEDFLVGRIGNVVIGSGTSGHGFKFGPLLGAWLAGLAADGVPGVALPGELARFCVPGAIPARFAPTRFQVRSGYAP